MGHIIWRNIHQRQKFVLRNETNPVHWISGGYVHQITEIRIMKWNLSCIWIPIRLVLSFIDLSHS